MSGESVDLLIGRLEGKVDNLSSFAQQEAERAARSRQRVYEKLEGFEKTVGQHDTRLVTVENKVRRLSPLARAAAAAGLVFGVAGSVLAMNWQRLVDLLSRGG